MRLIGLCLTLALAWSPPAEGWAAEPSAAPMPCTTPSTRLFDQVPWALTRLAPQRVWPLTKGQGVLVGVVDTGVDAGVPQLTGKVRQGIDVINGSGVADNDCFGHGTFVAGIIAAQPANGTAVVGLAPGATILPIRQANGRNDGSAQSLATSIRAAVDMGARVVNVSASAFFPSTDLELAVKYAAERDVLLVAAVANQAQEGNPVSYPAAYPSVLAVGSIGPDGRRSEFSETGSYVDIVAPGVDIVSLSRGGRGHLMDSGTSFATPFVSATAALVRAYHPQLTAAQVKWRLEVTADHPAANLPDPQLGWGVVNPFQAVTEVVATEYAKSPTPQGQQYIAPVVLGASDTGQRDGAVAFAVGALVAAVVIGLLARLIPMGMRRGWRSVGELKEESEPKRRKGGTA